MEIKTKKGSHNGRNVKIARMTQNISQSDLADKLNMHQTEISKLESKEYIEDEILKSIAIALDVNYLFLKDFDVEEAVYHNYFNVSGGEQSQENTNAQGDQKNVVNHFPLKEVLEMHEKFVALQEKHHEEVKNLLKDTYAKDSKIGILEFQLQQYTKNS